MVDTEAQELQPRDQEVTAAAVAVRVVRQLQVEALDPKDLTGVRQAAAIRHIAAAAAVETLPLAQLETLEQEMAALEVRILELRTVAVAAAEFTQGLAVQLEQAALVVVAEAASVADRHLQVLLARQILVAAAAAAALVVPERGAPEATAEAASSWFDTPDRRLEQVGRLQMTAPIPITRSPQAGHTQHDLRRRNHQ